MAKKHKQKKSKSTAKPMAVDAAKEAQPVAMDTSEVSTTAIKVAVGHSGIKKRHAQRRAQRLRKERALEKAVSTSEKKQEKTQKNQLKSERVLSLKGLY